MRASCPSRSTACGIGVALLLDSTLRLWIVSSAPLAEAAWLSNVPHLTAMLLSIGVSALAGRRFSRLVDEHM